MRVLFTILPGTGHLDPVVRLAAALRERDHEVAVACAELFVPEVESRGLAAFAAGPDWTEAEADLVVPGFTDADGLTQVRAFATLAGRGMVEDLLEIGAAWRPDLIVRETFEWGGWVAAELLRIPHAVLSIGVGIPHELVAAIAGDLLTGLLAAHGLPADPDLARSEQHLYLVGCPPSLDPPGMARPPAHARIRPLTLEPGTPALAVSTGRPLVHATLGTVFNRRPALLQAIADAAGELDVDLVLGVGADGAPESIDAPPNVTVERFVSHADLIPRCAALISHGGFGTLMAAAAAGVPVCLLPLSADQPLNAAVYAACGAGINLASTGDDGRWRAIDPDAVVPARIADALAGLLGDRRYKEAARRLAAEIESLPPPAHAVLLLEGLIS
ncbi:MAG: glycosyltransferase [Baekduia sp.]